MQLPDDNLNYPVKIQIGDSSGSGFFIGHDNETYLVTAKHVLYSAQTGDFYNQKLKLIFYPHTPTGTSDKSLIYELDLARFLEDGNIKAHPVADIIVIKIYLTHPSATEGILDNTLVAGIKILQDAEGTIVQYALDGSRKFNEVGISNDVFVLGYPISLSTLEMNQIDYDVPLVRKGIVAGKNFKNKTLILDCPVYGGNSGGLVLEVNKLGPMGGTKFHLIGIVVQFVPFVDVWSNKRFPGLQNTNYQNSGYSVALPVDYIYELIEKIESN